MLSGAYADFDKSDTKNVINQVWEDVYKFFVVIFLDLSYPFSPMKIALSVPQVLEPGLDPIEVPRKIFCIPKKFWITDFLKTLP